MSVVFEASVRPISASSRKVLRDLALCCAGNPDHYKGYVREIRFVDNGADYWLAIKDGLVADLQKQSKAGDVVDLFLIRLSPPETKGQRRSVLLVERFQKAGTNNVEIEESLAWIRSNLASHAQRNLTVEVPAPCQLKITELSNSTSVSKAIAFVPLAYLDVSKVKVEPRSDVWSLWLHAVTGKKIRFMLYQGVAAEGGQAENYSLMFRDREKAEAVAEAFRRTINLCARPSL